MSRSILLGLPPGVTNRMIEEAQEQDDGQQFYAALAMYRNGLEEMFYYTRSTMLVDVSNAIAERAATNGGAVHISIQGDMVRLTDEQQAVYLEQGRLVL